MRDLKEFLVLILAIFGFVSGVVLVGGSLVCAIDYTDCRGFERGTGIPTRWSFGCYASVDGKWIPKEYAFGKVLEMRVKEQEPQK